MKKLLLSLGALSAVVAPVAAVVACGSKTETPAKPETPETPGTKDALASVKALDVTTVKSAGYGDVTEKSTIAKINKATTVDQLTAIMANVSSFIQSKKNAAAKAASVELQQINIENTSLSTIRTGIDVADVHNQYAVNSIKGFTFITYERTTKNTKAPISHLANIEVFLVPNSDISVEVNKDFTVNEGSATEALLTKEKITATDFKALKAEIHSGDTKSDVITTSEDNKELLESGKPAQVWVSENENDFQYLMELNYKFTDAAAKAGVASSNDEKLMSTEYNTLKKF